MAIKFYQNKEKKQKNLVWLVLASGLIVIINVYQLHFYLYFGYIFHIIVCFIFVCPVGCEPLEGLNKFSVLS